VLNLIPQTVLPVAAAVAGGQEYPAATLYVVATPIGNLADISLRAWHVLSLVDAVACEDTRHSAVLMRHLGLHKPLLALHGHNEHEAAQGVVLRLARAERVAYVSDAGTPAISDPGAHLVALVRRAGFRAVPLPGASSVVTALSVAGVEAQGGFRFVGFLPAQARERERLLKGCIDSHETQVLFEAPHRIEALCQALAALCPQRMLSLCRELTKQFESVHTLCAGEAPAWLAAAPHRCRGEFVVVVHGHSVAASDADNLSFEPTLHVLLRDLPLKQAVALTAEITGVARNILYARALVHKKQLDSL
jgi:16S rRNA (cytidine1402-2'-O)-methyltransferase